jgi:glycosyltransferase involved in cell wall biosynthesis
MKLGALIPVLNEWRFVPAVAGQLLGAVDRCVILRGNLALSGAPVEVSPVPELDPRIEIVEGNWQSENETRNAGMDLLSDCDYILMVDSDEILLDEDLQRLRVLCETDKPQVIGVRLHTYWKTPDYRIQPPEDGLIKMVLRKDVRIEGLRGVQSTVTQADVWCRHLSYVRTDEELREKLRLFSHADDIRPHWYERVWKAWDSDQDLEDLHPIHPSAYKRAVYAPDPALEAVLAKWGCQ